MRGGNARFISMLVVFLLALPLSLFAQNDSTQTEPSRPCERPEFRQFDFWLGTWDLTWPDSGVGTNRITQELDSCVIMEHFDSAPSGAFRGYSVSTYNVHTDQWQQTWVDNNGGYLDFVGGLAGDSMILSREAVDAKGNDFLQRMVWYNITPDSLDWSWQRSTAVGEPWKTLWQIHYVRHQSAAGRR